MDSKIIAGDLFEQLSEETKEKLMKCTCKEEALEILKADMVPISDDDLDAVSGGWDVEEILKYLGTPKIVK